MSAELQTPRGRTFFWLGMAVLPVFWLGWMNTRQFTRWQIRTACVWTLLYLAAVIAFWRVSPEFQSRLALLPWNYAYISFHVGIALWIWLLFRTLKISQIIVGFLVSMDAIAILVSLAFPLLHSLLANPLSLLFILVPAAAHLMVEPLRRRSAQRLSHRPWYSSVKDMAAKGDERVDLTEAQNIADRHLALAPVADGGPKPPVSFGFGWNDEYIEFCISAPAQITCTLKTTSPSMSSLFRRWFGIRQQEEQLHDRAALMQRIHDFYTLPSAQLHALNKQRR